MIRPTEPEDTPALVELARETGVFKPMEIVALGEVLDDYHAGAASRGHRAVTSVRDGRVVGFAYFAPAAMTDRTWYLYWIAVDRTVHARGLGSELLRHVEDEARLAGCRLFLIETSSMPHYEPTRRFYERHGYPVWCVVRDFYADGDDMVIFAKRLTSDDAS
jgi:GNAT superfamily N-acetyltransferase